MKILFCLNSLRCGGIEKSALTLITQLLQQGNDVRLRLTRKEGEFLSCVPKEIKVEELDLSVDARYELTFGRKLLLRKYLREKQFVPFIKLLFHMLFLSTLSQESRFLAICKRLCASIHNDTEVYDLAIDFSEFTEIYYVANCVKAKRKAIWLHTELAPGFTRIRRYIQYLAKFDEINCVSQALLENARVLLPELASRMRLYRHTLDGERIRQMADVEIADWGDGHKAVKILTVGRFEWQKGFDLIPGIAQRLVNSGFVINWVILGDGNERRNVQDRVRELNLGNVVSLLGMKLNPYPYYKTCDIYVQTSRYEGYCLTVAEARIFEKPIVATDFNGAKEQLMGRREWLVVKCDEESIFNGIVHVIKVISEESRELYG
jgi:glycosyltransferase involved in cell wall biosynthesis